VLEGGEVVAGATIFIPILGLLIQFVQLDELRRVRIMRSLSAAVAALYIPATILVTVQRGLSKSSAFLAACVLIWMGVYLLLLVAVPPGGTRSTKARRRQSRRLRRTMAVLCFLGAWGSIVALRYGGALQHDGVGSVIAQGLSVGYFAPLEVERPIAVGQCLVGRVPARKNLKVPCNKDHRSQVIGTADAAEDCPRDEVRLQSTLILKGGALDPIEGVVYCVLQARYSNTAWRGWVDLHSGTMARTT
jgi:hypothetical protein